MPESKTGEDQTTGLRRLLKEHFGHSDFRGIQAAIIAHTLDDKHALVLMPTGAGKSLCFQLPSLVRDLRGPGIPRRLTIVVSPLIALMKDQVDVLVSRGIEATFINSSLDSASRKLRYEEVADGKYGLLYVTPERFRKVEFWEVLRQRWVDFLVVDEAHCISEWGHDFRPDYSRLREIRQQLGHPVTMAVTATATREVQDDIRRQLGLETADCRIFADGTGRSNLALEVVETWGLDEKISKIVELIQATNDSPQPTTDSASHQATSAGSGIVYFTLIKTLQECSELLRQQGLNHLCYHGDLTRPQRRQVQDAFMNNELPWVLATNAFGMGIDKPDIRCIIHAEVPGSLEAYCQEIGRAGRDGLPADCWLLYDQADLQTQIDFMRWSNPDGDYYVRLYDLLNHDADPVRSFGIEWLREKLAAKDRRDRRLETALGMLQRYGIIEDEEDLTSLNVIGDLPESLADPEIRLDKLRRDQRKLYAMVEYVRSPNRRAFIEDYFYST
jgi:ATP-dependent DNA helicase RecQ